MNSGPDTPEKNFQQARDTALRYISQQSRTILQVRNYLKNKDYSPDLIEQVIQYCKDYNYLNDSEYARIFIRNVSVYKSQGPYKIQQRLLERGIAKEVIQDAMAEIFAEVDEVEILRKLLEKRYSPDQLKDFKTRQKAARFLAGRGFSHALIMEVLGRI